MMVDNIPVIDIAELDSAATRAEIDHACRDWGFFQIVGHGLDAALTERLVAVSGEFFGQRAELKRLLLRDADNPWGYFDQELTKNQRDWKELFDFCPIDTRQLARRLPAGELQQRFETTLQAYHDSCTTLARQLLAAMLRTLGADAADVLRGFDRQHTSFLRLNHYPPQPRLAGEGPKALGVGEHTDAGALTLLLQDEQAGLEVRRDGRWHRVAPLKGALVVNIGDIVQVWSNDRYAAALHRVITNPTQDRFSAAFFLNPSYETVYQPLPPTVTADRPARYRRIGWREFRTLRAAGDYADLGEEVQIEHFRQQGT